MNKGEPQTNGARTTEYLMGQGGNLNPYLTLYTQKNFIYLCMYVCMYVWLRWVFVVARRPSLLQQAGATLRCAVWTTHCGGFSCCRARALGARASVVVAHGLQ